MANAVKKAINEQFRFDKHFEISMTYFLDYDSTDVDDIKNKLEHCSCMLDYYVDEDEDEDGINVNCIFGVEVDLTKDDELNYDLIDAEFGHILRIYNLDENIWDYHYIKGVDNDFYWEP